MRSASGRWRTAGTCPGSFERFLIEHGERVLRIPTHLTASAAALASAASPTRIDAVNVARAALREGLHVAPGRAAGWARAGPAPARRPSRTARPPAWSSTTRRPRRIAAAVRARLRATDGGQAGRRDRRRRPLRHQRQARPRRRRRPDPRQLRTHRPPPPRPRRQPPDQRRHPPRRRHPRPLPPRNPCLPRPQTSRRQEHPRSHPLPQTPPRPSHLASPPGRPARRWTSPPINFLT